MRERVSRYLNFDGNWKLCKWSRKSVDNKVTYRGGSSRWEDNERRKWRRRCQLKCKRSDKSFRFFWLIFKAHLETTFFALLITSLEWQIRPGYKYVYKVYVINILSARYVGIRINSSGRFELINFRIIRFVLIFTFLIIELWLRFVNNQALFTAKKCLENFEGRLTIST